MAPRLTAVLAICLLCHIGISYAAWLGTPKLAVMSCVENDGSFNDVVGKKNGNYIETVMLSDAKPNRRTFLAWYDDVGTATANFDSNCGKIAGRFGLTSMVTDLLKIVSGKKTTKSTDDNGDATFHVGVGTCGKLIYQGYDWTNNKHCQQTDSTQGVETSSAKENFNVAAFANGARVVDWSTDNIYGGPYSIGERCPTSYDIDCSIVEKAATANDRFKHPLKSYEEVTTFNMPNNRHDFSYFIIALPEEEYAYNELRWWPGTYDGSVTTLTADFSDTLLPIDDAGWTGRVTSVLQTYEGVGPYVANFPARNSRYARIGLLNLIHGLQRDDSKTTYIELHAVKLFYVATAAPPPPALETCEPCLTTDGQTCTGYYEDNDYDLQPMCDEGACCNGNTNAGFGWCGLDTRPGLERKQGDCAQHCGPKWSPEDKEFKLCAVEEDYYDNYRKASEDDDQQGKIGYMYADYYAYYPTKDMRARKRRTGSLWGSLYKHA